MDIHVDMHAYGVSIIIYGYNYIHRYIRKYKSYINLWIHISHNNRKRPHTHSDLCGLKRHQATEEASRIFPRVSTYRYTETLTEEVHTDRSPHVITTAAETPSSDRISARL